MASADTLPLANATLTASANSDAVNVRVGAKDFFVSFTGKNVDASTTFDLKLQHSANGVEWYDVDGGAFTQVSGAGDVDELLDLSKGLTGFSPTKLLGLVRVVSTISGATPSIDVVCSLHFDKEF